MTVFWNIVPIFSVIALGWFGHRLRFIPEDFVTTGNKVVFYLGVPALLFRAVSKAPFHEVFNPLLVLSVTLPLLGVWGVALILTRVSSGLQGGTRGSFLQSSVHGNIGYIGLAVVFYLLGEEGVRLAGTVIGFLIIAQNMFAVLSLNLFSDKPTKGPWRAAKEIALNPIILACLSGLIVSYLGLSLPWVGARFLDILGGMALPVALLIIGANLSLQGLRTASLPLLLSTVMKVGLLPLVGILTMGMLLPTATSLQRGVLIALLGAPTATVTTIMAGEMGGDVSFASGAVTLSTVASVMTYTLWFALPLS